jgi:hypothetical protein
MKRSGNWILVTKRVFLLRLADFAGAIAFRNCGVTGCKFSGTGFPVEMPTARLMEDFTVGISPVGNPGSDGGCEKCRSAQGGENCFFHTSFPFFCRSVLNGWLGVM